MIVNIDDYRQHVVLVGASGNHHVVPLSLLEDVAAGRKDITEVEDYADIVTAIFPEWLMGLYDN